MKYFYQLDIAAAVLSLILLIVILTRKSYETTRRKLFKTVMAVCCVSSVLEIFSSFTWGGLFNFPIWAIQVINILNLLVHFSIHTIFVYYIQSMVGKEKTAKSTNIIILIVSLVVVIFVSTNPLHNFVFVINEDNTLTSRFGKNYILDVISLISIIYSLIIYLRRDFKNKYETIVNISFFIALFSSVIFEEICRTILVENFTITIFLTILAILFDNPNKYFYGSTTVFNEYTFNKIYSSKIKLNIPFKLVAFAFADFDLYIQKIGKTRTDNIIRIVAEECKKAYGNQNVFIFGRNVIVVDVENKNPETVAVAIDYNSHKNAIEKNPEIKLNANCVLVDCPKDINNIPDLHDYIYAVLFNESFEDSNVYKFNPDILKRMARQKNILMLLHDAIDNDGFDIYFQPIYDAKFKKFNSLEALIRLKATIDGKSVSPSEFIPLAEKTGLIFEIDEIVFEKVCRYVRNADLKKYGIKFVHVNMSLYKLIYPEVVDRYYELVKRYEVDPSFFNLEITETAEGDEKYLSIIRQNIAKFSEKGFNFSLDDYGSGYSSVIYMAEMETKIVKIDAAIVWNALKNRKYFTVLENCIRLIYCFGKECIAEGIENEEMVKMLNRLGVKYYQGYYYSKPLSEKDTLAFLEKNN